MPRMRRSSILILAIGSGLAAFILSVRVFNTQPQPPQTAVSNFMVVTALRDISVGTTIKAEDLELLPAPPKVKRDVLFTNLEDVVGEITSRQILKGQPIRTVDLIGAQDNLAKLIPEGYRAMTIPVVLPLNLTNLIQVGNRVDVILTYEPARGKIESMTLVENAKVIGTSEPTNAQAGQKEMYITLAVSPAGAETLAYAMKRGTLTVSVRSAYDLETGEEKFFTLKDLFFKDKRVAPQKVQETITIEVIRGVRKESYTIPA